MDVQIIFWAYIGLKIILFFNLFNILKPFIKPVNIIKANRIIPSFEHLNKSKVLQVTYFIVIFIEMHHTNNNLRFHRKEK